MTNIKFGAVFFVFAALMFYIMNFTPGETTGSIFWGNFILLLFMGIGLAFIITGIRKLIRDKKTDLKGELCYGQVTAVKFNGTVINGIQQHDAYLKVYIESEDKFVECHEDIGGRVDEFPIGAFYAVKYYEGDINMEYKVPSFDGLPVNIKNVFDTGEIIPGDDSWYNTSSSSHEDITYNPNNMYNYDYEK